MEFEYVVIDKEGKRVQSFMKAESTAAVAASLRNSGGKPLKITQLKKEQAPNLVERFFSGPKRVTAKERVVFTRQLGTMLSAGVLLSDAMETIADNMENKYFAGVLHDVILHIHAGESYSNALARHPSIFFPYYVAIVNSGEAIGLLGKTIGNLATFMEDDAKMRLKFIAAVRYPIFLMSFVFCIVSGIVLFLIPKFKAIFEGAHIQLPLLTRIVVGVSEFSLHYFVLIIIGIALIVFAAWRALQIFRVRFMVDYMLLHIPIIGNILRKSFIARFCQTLSMLLEGGVGIIPALALSKNVVENFYLKYVIEDIRQSVVAGVLLNTAMYSHADMPRLLIKMVAVGEKSGMLGSMLKRLGDFYDQEVDTFLNNINSILEPVFIIFIGGIVLVVALALYLPIFMMSSAVH